MTLWSKGHNPNIRDPEIRQAVKLMGKLESGVQIPEKEITTLYGEIMQLIKARLNEKQRKEFAEQTI